MMITVYGSIKNIITGEEFIWPDNQNAQTIFDQLQSVDPAYGKGWVYGGDIGLEDGNIHIKHGKEYHTYYGETAVSFAIEFLAKVLPSTRALKYAIS